MCGRAYETYSDEELYFRYLEKNPEMPLGLTPVYNLCPTQTSPVLRVLDGERRFDIMRWQLIPRTEPAFTTKLSTINARSESVFESPLYRDLVIRQRCVIPLSGFYEWKRGDRSRPYRIQLCDEPIMSVAGIWDTWRPGTTEERQSFSILTTSANEVMQEIHDRMPVILARSDEETWLDPENRDRRALQALFKPCLSSLLSVREVSTLVNSPKNNSSALLEPASSPAANRQSRLFD